MSDLRKPFWDQVEALAQKDKDIIVLTGDLGFSFCEGFAERRPEQYINAGIAEQNMVGVAAGLALAGKKPYIYSGAIFAVMRPYEFIRDDVAFNNLDVKIIGTGASGFLGFTHNMVGGENEEDLLKNLPNLKRFYPRTPEELQEALTSKGPAYIRL